MDGSRITLNLIAIAAVVISLPMASDAAEKVRFGTQTRTTSIQTQPIPTIENELPKPIDNIGNVNATVRPGSLPTGATTVVKPASESENNENWIFNDTKSQQGIQRALGIEVYEAESPTGSVNTPTSEVEQYFERQNQFDGGEASFGGFEAMENFDSSIGNVGTEGFGNRFSNGNSGTEIFATPIGAGNGGFKKTLNSSNPSIRSYYQNLYKNQISPKTVVPALEAADIINRQSQEESRTRQLFNRAAMIESMTPKGPTSVFENSQDGLAPTVTQRERRLDTPLIERRGGKTVIPSRPF